LSNRRDTSKELKQLRIFSGSDHFMSGHQIINRNRSLAGPRRKNSEWALDDTEVRRILKRSFPKLATNEKQRERAGRWATVIQLYFRKGLTLSDVAVDLKMTPKNTGKLIRRIQLAQRGLRTDESGAYRKHGGSETSLGDQ
jgi:hypothetical protein